MPNNIYESLDELLARQKSAEERSKQEHEELLQAIREAKKTDPLKQSVNQRNQASALKRFIQSSAHEYMWFGTKADFHKEKRLVLILLLSSIVSMLACAMAATALFGLYTTFTFFENVWLLLSLYLLKYTCKTKKNYPDWKYSLNSFKRFLPDADGVLRHTVIKKKYKWFFVLACIAFLSNIGFAWTDDYSGQLFITVLELGTLALNVFTAIKVIDFFGNYTPIKFTGKNEAGTAKVALIFCPLQNKLYTEEDYVKSFPFVEL